MPDGAYVIAEAVAEELATLYFGFYSDKKQGTVAAFLSPQPNLPAWVARRPPRVGAPYA